MRKILFFILAVVLFCMYATDFGIPGIVRHWEEFKLLDMQFHYSATAVWEMMEQLGTAGIRHYLYYFGIDGVFIAVLFFLQWNFSQAAAGKWKNILCCFTITRAVFDIVEDLLLSLIFREIIEVKVTPFASVATSLKFLSLFFWGLAIVLAELTERRRLK